MRPPVSPTARRAWTCSGPPPRRYDVVARLAPGSDALIVEATREPALLGPPDRDARRLHAAIGRLHADDIAADLMPAVALAADRLRARGGRPHLVIITDGAVGRDTALSVGGIPAEVVRVGDEQENTAITRLDVRPGVDPVTGREQAQVFALVQRYDAPGKPAAPREARVTVTLEGGQDAVASRTLLMSPGDRQPVVLTFEPREEDRGRGLVVRLSPGDAAPFDDVAYGRVPAATRLPVVLASDADASWLARALGADEGVDLRRITLTQLSKVPVDPDALVVVEEESAPICCRAATRSSWGRPRALASRRRWGPSSVTPQVTSTGNGI